MSSAVLRIAWKEYRTLRAMWLVLAVTVIVLETTIVFFAGSGIGLWRLALCTPIIFAVGAAAASFASERELRTDDLLHCWAASAWSLYATKVFVAAVATLLMSALLCGVLALLSRDWTPLISVIYPPYYADIVAYDAIPREVAIPGSPVAFDVSAQRLSWYLVLSCVGLFFSVVVASLLTKQTLHAAILGGIGWIFAMMLGMWMVSHRVRELYPDRVLAAIAVMAFVLSLVATSTWQRGLDWHKILPSLPRRRRATAALLFANDKYSSNSRQLRRMLWKEWREARGTLGMLLVGSMALLIFLILISKSDATFGFATFVTIVTSLLAGASTFHAEKVEDRYRFLGERSIPGIAVWIGKLTVWTACAGITWLVVFFVAHLLYAYGIVFGAEFHVHQSFDLPTMLIVPLIAFAAAQLLSLLVTQILVAIGLALAITGLASAWMGGMNALGVPLWWSVGSIPVILLFASLLETSPWLAERRDWRSGWGRRLLLYSPLLAIPVGVIVFRIVQIPALPLAPMPSFEITREAKETADLYRQAFANVHPIDRNIGGDDEEIPESITDWEHTPAAEKAWLAANDTAIAVATEASLREECASTDPNVYGELGADGDYWETQAIVELLLLSALKLESERDYKGALDRYLTCLRIANHVAQYGDVWQWIFAGGLEAKTLEQWCRWASLPDQSPELLRAASAEGMRITTEFPSASRALDAELLANFGRLANLDDWAESLERGKQGMPIDITTDHFGGGEVGWLLHNFMPWEIIRARRLLILSFNVNRYELDDLEARLQSVASQTPSWPFRAIELSEDFDHWNQTTILRMFRLQLATPEEAVVDRRQHIRISMLTLALYIARAENGSFPRTLDELVGPVLKILPVDIFTGSDFHYEPDGLPYPLELGENLPPLPAKRPFFWYAGNDGIRLQRVDLPKQAPLQVLGPNGLPIPSDTAVRVRHHFQFLD